MNSNQIIILSVFLGYLLFNVVVSFVYSRKAEKSLNTSEEKKYFIGGRNMNGIVLAMTIMATYTSASSFISGPGAAGLTYGYAQAWIAAIQVPVTFLVLGVLGNKLALVSRRTGAVTVVGYFKARYKSSALVIITSVGLIAFFIAQMISLSIAICPKENCLQIIYPGTDCADDKPVYRWSHTYCFNNRIGPRNFAFDFWNRCCIVHSCWRI